MKKYFFTIVLPLSKKAEYVKVKKCVASINKQLEEDYELIVVTDKSWKEKLKKYKNIKFEQHNVSKTEARNLGSKKSKGKYLVHLDHDMYLLPTTLSSIKGIIQKTGIKALSIPPEITGNSYLNKIYKLEYKITKNHDLFKGFPVVEKKLFFQVSGFNKEIDVLDDWSLKANLIKNKSLIKCTNRMANYDPSTSIKTLIKRKINRGRNLPVFKSLYPKEYKIIANKKDLLRLYLTNGKLMIKDPITAIGLLLLKPIEWMLLYLGSLWPENFNRYKLKKTATIYDKKRSNSNYQKYKNYAEKKALLSLLKKDLSIVEVASGTGRITKFLIKNGFSVIPTEPSSEMIKQYKKKPGLPRVIKISAQNLDKLKLKRDVVLGIRLIWHIKSNKEKLEILKKSAQMSKKHVIYDFVNYGRYGPIPFPDSHPLTLPKIKNLAKKAGLKVDKKVPLDTIQPVWLNLFSKNTTKKLLPHIYKLDLKLSGIIPPGRWMIKFKKI